MWHALKTAGNKNYSFVDIAMITCISAPSGNINIKATIQQN